MPEHLRALVVILILAVIVFSFSRRVTSELVSNKDFLIWRNTWIAVTCSAFLAHSIWLYFVLAVMVIIFYGRQVSNRLALFYVLLFAVPSIQAEIPGFGLMNYLFSIDHARLLALIILLPIAFSLNNKGDAKRFGSVLPDKILAIYLVIISVLQLRDTTFTDAARQVLYLLLDIYLPYYVFSRAPKTRENIDGVLAGFIVAGMLLAAIGLFEYSRHWLLYNALISSWGMEWGYLHYLGRLNSLRATATTGQSIAFGFVVTVAIGVYFYISNYTGKSLRKIGYILLPLGLFVALSRGPWVGAVIMLFVYIILGRFALRRVVLFTLSGCTVLFALMFLPGGDKLIDLLPFIGTTEKFNVDYRGQLFEVATSVISQHPFFGSANYLASPEFDPLRMGHTGFVDIVNSYLGIALEYGLIGLTLFALFFVVIMYKLYRRIRSEPDYDCSSARLGRAFLATIVGILVIITTVSGITVIPILYWSITGLAVSFLYFLGRPNPEVESAYIDK